MCKRFFTLVLCLCLFMNLVAAAFAADVEINETNFPDATFRSYVSSNFDKDSSGGLSNTEIADVTSINVIGKDVSSLKGVEFFTALTVLRCEINQLTALDVSKNTALTTLDCHNNQLTALDVSKNTSLTHLDCQNNQLTALDVSKNTALTVLFCYNNQLTTLDVSKNTALTGLNCENNKLTVLDINNTALTWLYCGSNQLTALDVSKNAALTELHCADNQLTTLDISKNAALTWLDCSYNQLTSFTLDEQHLRVLNLDENTELSSLTLGDQTTSSDVALSYDSSNSLYPYNINLSWILYDALESVKRITSLTAFDANANILTVSQDANIVYCSAKPSRIVYRYDPKAPSSVNTTLRVTVNFTSDTGTNTNTNTGSDVVTINETNFPDANFRSYVSSNFDTDSSGGLSSSEIANVTSINVNSKTINSLKGIEYLTALTSLNCTNNKLTELDISKNTALTDVWCNSNDLISLNIANSTALTYLYCSYNQLTALDVSKNTALTTLDCAANKLTALDVTKNTALVLLECSFNQLTALDVSQNTGLLTLYCFANLLTTLDVSKNTALEVLVCDTNQLTTLDVSKNTALTSLYCGNNQLTTFILGKQHLRELTLDGNNSMSSLTLGEQEISVDIKPTYDPSNASFPYKLASTAIFPNSFLASPLERISSATAFDSSGNTLSVSQDTETVYFSAQPSSMVYYFDPQAPSSVNTPLRVTINFTTSATNNESTNPGEGTSINSRSYIHGFTMTDSLRNSILAAFPGLSASEIFQFTDSEIIEDTWSLQAQDTSTINNLGESVVINLPAVSPSNTGVYVMRFSLADAEVGRPLSAHSVYGNAYSSSVNASDVGSLEYKFFDENYNEVTTVPEGKVVYAAVKMTAGQASRGVLTTSGLDIGNVQPVPQELRTDLNSKIRETLSGDISPEAEINFIEPKNIGEPIEPSDSLKNKVQSEKANLIGKFNTLSVDVDGIYVWKVTLTPELEKEFVSQDVSNFRIYSADVTPTDFIAISSVKPSFLFGLLNTFELLTMSGERMQFGAKEFLMVGFLNAGKPFSFYLAKLIFALLFGGCNVGFGVIGIGVLGFFAFKIFKRKN